MVIADELHAFACDDRGWHLRALLSRIDVYAMRAANGRIDTSALTLQRIGLSATFSKPEQLLAWFARAAAANWWAAPSHPTIAI